MRYDSTCLQGVASTNERQTREPPPTPQTVINYNNIGIVTVTSPVAQFGCIFLFSLWYKSLFWVTRFVVRFYIASENLLLRRTFLSEVVSRLWTRSAWFSFAPRISFTIQCSVYLWILLEKIIHLFHMRHYQNELSETGKTNLIYVSLKVTLLEKKNYMWITLCEVPVGVVRHNLVSIFQSFYTPPASLTLIRYSFHKLSNPSLIFF